MDLNQLVRKLEQKKSALVAFRDSRWPKRVGEMAISHFKRNFREGGWCDIDLKYHTFSLSVGYKFKLGK